MRVACRIPIRRMDPATAIDKQGMRDKQEQAILVAALQ
jgi:hypothetical protein